MPVGRAAERVRMRRRRTRMPAGRAAVQVEMRMKMGMPAGREQHLRPN